MNTDANKESILVYNDSTVDYTIKGSNKSTIASVYWEVIGGFTENDTAFTVPVTWTDEDVKELIAHITYVDGTTADENFLVLSKVANFDPPPPPAPNVIAFDYDIAGNQWKRRFIYVASGIYRMANQPIAAQPKAEDLVESDIDKDILYYPNPVASELFVKWNNTATNAVESIELYSISGQLMRRYSNLKNDENSTLNFEGYPSGYYILNLSYTDGTVKDLRIIKK